MCTTGMLQTALSEASCQGHDAVVTLLLGLGADPNSKSDTGRTPLMSVKLLFCCTKQNTQLLFTSVTSIVGEQRLMAIRARFNCFSAQGLIQMKK